MIGKNFGFWKVLSGPIKRNKKTYYLCECKCNKQREVRNDQLLYGKTLKCSSCANSISSKKHGLSKNSIYTRWKGIKSRCLDPKKDNYSRYGKLGITICERWLKFENFLSDMGFPPFKKAQIDRIDPFGNYEPSNCRWVTPKENANNRKKLSASS